MRASIIALVGRILLASVFIFGGIEKVTHWSLNVGYVASHGVPVAPFFLAWALVIELIGGLAILFGVHARWVALLLAVYLIPVTLIMHDFWAVAGPERGMQLVNFLKNLAIMGGLLEVFAYGPGRLSLDESSYHRGGDSTVKLRRVS